MNIRFALCIDAWFPGMRKDSTHRWDVLVDTYDTLQTLWSPSMNRLATEPCSYFRPETRFRSVKRAAVADLGDWRSVDWNTAEDLPLDSWMDRNRWLDLPESSQDSEQLHKTLIIEEQSRLIWYARQNAAT